MMGKNDNNDFQGDEKDYGFDNNAQYDNEQRVGDDIDAIQNGDGR